MNKGLSSNNVCDYCQHRQIKDCKLDCNKENNFNQFTGIMIQSDAIRILAQGLAEHLVLRSEGREKESQAIGTVIEVQRNDNGQKDRFLFKYIYNTGEFGLSFINSADVGPNDIIHFHEDMGDMVTNAALHGDVITENDEL